MINPGSQHGKRILAQMTYLNQYQFIPYNRIVEYFEDIYLTQISEGAICQAIEALYEALSSAENEIINGLLNSEGITWDTLTGHLTTTRLKEKSLWLKAGKRFPGHSTVAKVLRCFAKAIFQQPGEIPSPLLQ